MKMSCHFNYRVAMTCPYGFFGMHKKAKPLNNTLKFFWLSIFYSTFKYLNVQICTSFLTWTMDNMDIDSLTSSNAKKYR